MPLQELILWTIPAIILIILVHGIWVKSRSKNGFLRMDIKPSKTEELGFENESVEPELKGELPNGGARILKPNSDSKRFNVKGRSSRLAGHVEPRIGIDRSDRSRSPNSSERSGSVITDTVEDNLESNVVVLHLISAAGSPIKGEQLVRALQKQNLKYGDMGIFHCIEVETKEKVYSVANALEPGSFDFSDMSSFSTVGITFLFTPNEHNEPIPAFDRLLKDASVIATELGCVLKDQNMSALSEQGVEHLRQQIIDFARRSLARR